MTDPEKATIGDLFRLMTESNKKINAMAGDLSSVKETVEGHTITLAEHTVTLAEHTAILKAHTGELEAIRNVVDNDLASHDQMLRVEGDIVEIKKTQRRHGKQIETLIKERA